MSFPLIMSKGFQKFHSHRGGWGWGWGGGAKPGNLNGSCVRDAVAGVYSFVVQIRGPVGVSLVWRLALLYQIE